MDYKKEKERRRAIEQKMLKKVAVFGVSIHF
jgi:hypothetical protein